MGQDALLDAHAWLNRALVTKALVRFPDESINGEALQERLARELITREKLNRAFHDAIFGKAELQFDDPLCRWMAWNRIIEARHFVEFLLAAGLRAPKQTLEPLLLNLLVDYWSELGYLRFRARLKS